MAASMKERKPGTIMITEAQSLLNGRCGKVDFESITGEYYPNGPSVDDLTPPISLNSENSWRPRRKKNYELKIDLGSRRHVYGFKTQGKVWKGVEEYVTKYEVLSGETSCDKMRVITELDGNKDASGIKRNTLELPILARCIVLRTKGYNNRPSLRIDILGY